MLTRMSINQTALKKYWLVNYIGDVFTPSLPHLLPASQSRRGLLFRRWPFNRASKHVCFHIRSSSTYRLVFVWWARSNFNIFKCHSFSTLSECFILVVRFDTFAVHDSLRPSFRRVLKELNWANKQSLGARTSSYLMSKSRFPLETCAYKGVPLSVIYDLMTGRSRRGEGFDPETRREKRERDIFRRKR